MTHEELVSETIDLLDDYLDEETFTESQFEDLKYNLHLLINLCEYNLKVKELNRIKNK